MLETLLWLLTIASWIFWLIAVWLAYRFFHGQAEPTIDFSPPVSVLKPVMGVDASAYENFASFCRQDYPEYELIFGAYDQDDPVIEVVERLQREFPERSIQMIAAQPVGANRKAGMLHHLTAHARYPILVASDSDMRATPDYLRAVVAQLADDQVGLVTCCYRGAEPKTLTARLEALHMGATFLPLVMTARLFLSMRFAMGATLAVRRSDLDQIGGFASVVDYLADDFQLGLYIARMGKRVVLARYVIASVLGATTFREEWDREVRWARTNRVCRPAEYPGQLLCFITPLALVLAVVTGLAPAAILALAVSVILRWIVAWLISGWTGDVEVRRWLFLLPLRDGLTVMTWAAGGLGRRVVWRTRRYVLEPDGRFEPEGSAAEVPVAASKP